MRLSTGRTASIVRLLTAIGAGVCAGVLVSLRGDMTLGIDVVLLAAVAVALAQQTIP